MECLAIFHFIDKKSPDTILETPCQCQHWQSMVAPGEHAVIKGSERITSWQHVEGNVWKVVLPNSFFGAFNPYKENVNTARHPYETYILSSTDRMRSGISPL